MKKIAIVGSRSFNDFDKLESFILNRINSGFISKVVSGGAKGADTLGEEFAKKYNKSTLIFLADWETHGKAAGMIRNKDIVENSDVVFAFWDGNSKGTKSSINLAKRMKKELYICYIGE